MKTTFDDPRLSAYLFGELNPEEKAAFEKELADNSELRLELEELRSFERQLQTALQKEADSFSLAKEQRAMVTQRFREKQRKDFWSPFLSAFLNRPGLSFACALALVGFCVFVARDMVVIPNTTRSVKKLEATPGSASVVTDMSVELQEESTELAGEIPIETLTPEAEASAGVSNSNSTQVAGNITGASQAPLLGDIPVVGRLFSSKNGVRAAVPSVTTSPANRPADLLASDSAGSGHYVTVVTGEKRRVKVSEGVFSSGKSKVEFYYDDEAKANIKNEAYDSVVENPFKSVGEEPLSTFSIDVDTASYTNLRRFLNQGLLPPPNAVRIEEMLNYFSYNYPQPTGEAPFSVSMEIASCPWNPEHQLAHIGVQGRKVSAANRAPLNLVFLIDVSGSMSDENKLPLVKKALQLLVKNLNPTDRVALVTYAGNSRLALPSTPATQKQKILQALERLESGGSTNGEGGIRRAYDVARENFIRKGINRVILATDGDFNVGVSDRGELVGLIQQEAKSGVYLNIFGFGMGNLKDATLEQLANKGNGIYGYIDSYSEARKVFAEQVNSTLITIAKDVKIQVEFNPARVGAYRLIGYENRMLNKEDFNDDRKDAGEVGAGHSVTALYELIPPGRAMQSGNVDPLKYQINPELPSQLSVAAKSGEVLTLKLRYKEPAGGSSKLLKVAVEGPGYDWRETSDNFRFSASVAAFGMVLKDSPSRERARFDLVEALAAESLGKDPEGYRREFLQLVKVADGLK
jgi:Ca-activated chloride channel family protein